MKHHEYSKYISVQLDNVSKTYLPGDCVSGFVVCDFPEEVRVQGLAVRCVGKSQVNWKDGTIGNRKNYSASEEYFNHISELIVNDGMKRVFQPGRELFSFQFNLPHRIPSSFSGKCGTVDYIISVQLTMNNKSVNICERFNVNGILDLNLQSDAWKPISISGCGNVMRKLVLVGGTVSFVLDLPKTGFVPGEEIHFNAQIHNQNESTVYHTKLVLMREEIYTASIDHPKHNCDSYTSLSGTKIKQTILKTIEGPRVEKGEIKCWNCEPMELPKIPPTGLVGCSFISINYYLKFQMELPCGGLNVENTCKIIIGTILQNNLKQLHENESTGADIGPKMTAFKNFHELPPPSYSEVIQMEKCIGTYRGR